MRRYRQFADGDWLHDVRNFVPAPPQPPYRPAPRNQPAPAGSPVGGGNVNVPLSNGGIFAATNVAMFPCFSLNDNTIGYFTFDTTETFNDQNIPSSYSWRVEQIAPFRQPTVRRVLVTYKDLGIVTATFSVSGCNDVGNVVSVSQTATWGNNPPTNALFTTKVDLQLTCLNPQLSVYRAANAGPLCIIQAVLVLEVEDVKL